MNTTQVTNFMQGNSYQLNPLITLKIISASSVFGEPSYYRKSNLAGSKYTYESKNYCVIPCDSSKSTVDIFTEAIDRSLDFDFAKTLEFAKDLRENYFMRLNPSFIFIRASMHHKRPDFNKNNPSVMKNIGISIILRPDDITNQFDYYKHLKGSKNNLPNIVKRVWANKLKGYSNYHLNKYLSNGKLIDLVRISHAHSDNINKMMKTGKVNVEDSSQTWENLRSQGMSWSDIISTIDIPHMALLRNIRGIYMEIRDESILLELMESKNIDKIYLYDYGKVIHYDKEAQWLFIEDI